MFGECVLSGCLLAGWNDDSIAAVWEETGIEKTVEESE
jgi:hypothetical protein